jgi:hypothetical protein
MEGIMAQLILTLPTESQSRRFPDLIMVAYREDDQKMIEPVGAIISSGRQYRAEGYATGFHVKTGTLADCKSALADYPNRVFGYGDPDTDWGLLTY